MIRRPFSSGIGDRGGSSVNAVYWALAGITTTVIIAWNVAKYQRDGRTLRRLYDNTLLSWGNVLQGRWWVLLTNAVTHIDVGHFVFNMFALNAFSGILAMVPGIGGFGFLALCTGSGLAASAAFLLYDYIRVQQASSKGPVRPGTACGLSGVTMGLAAAAACVLPWVPMTLMFIPIPIKLYQVAAGYVLIDLLFIGSNDSIGHAAHLGGFGYGVLHYLVFIRRLRIPGSWLQPKSIARR